MTADGNVAAGKTLVAEAIGTNTMFNGQSELDGRFHMVQEIGHGHWTGGAMGDTLDIGDGASSGFNGGGSSDTVKRGAFRLLPQYH